MKKYITMLIFAMLTGICYGQLSQITGKITAFGGFALQNVPVAASKSKQKVTTDSLGIFTIACKNNDVLKINADQFKYQRVKLNGLPEDTLLVELDFDMYRFDIDKAVQNGYISEVNVFGIREYLDEHGPDYCSFNDMYGLIEVCCPGVKVDYESSPPKVSLYSSAYNVLYVVNGVESSFIDLIRPCDVKSIRVIKDVGSLAAWGTKGADGVIAITTK
ncbi:MAG: hypothetical protein JW798_13960 [Prolixibacteraceae bacterium]|nr:hypothetical protein [Prolixibacteraceae bacterium]